MAYCDPALHDSETPGHRRANTFISNTGAKVVVMLVFFKEVEGSFGPLAMFPS